jgi:hypothetical protein
MLKACCVMIFCYAPVGMAVRVACGLQWGMTHDGAAPRLLRWGALTSMGVNGLITLVARHIPCMLLRVICQCSLGVEYSMHFAIRFCVSIMGGASGRHWILGGRGGRVLRAYQKTILSKSIFSCNRQYQEAKCLNQEANV